MDENEKQIEQESFVLIKFEGAGKSAFNLAVNNASPAQILGAIGILEVYAKDAYLQEQRERMERMAQTKLTVPNSKIEIGRK